MSSTQTTIEWTDKTWNPTTGCTKVSPGCKHCYAETITQRFTQHFPNGFEFTMREDRLNEPRTWRKPSRVFVNSMSDLFHEDMPFDFLERIFQVMAECPKHVFQILTKRHKRLAKLAPRLKWPPNVWIGVSIENQKYAERADYLRKVEHAAVRFLSCEPLLGSLELNLTDIHWVITGGESGRGHRPIEEEWVRAIQQQCKDSDVAFFHKQWGGRSPKSGGRLLDGQTWDEMPQAWFDHLERLGEHRPLTAD
jgi:protein gp37